MVKSRYIGDGHPTFNRNPYNGYINPYYWADDHPLLYGSLDPGTYEFLEGIRKTITTTTGTVFVIGLRQAFWSTVSIFPPLHETRLIERCETNGTLIFLFDKKSEADMGTVSTNRKP